MSDYSAVDSLAGKKIWVTGHRGMLGSAMLRKLEGEGCQILTTTRAEVDLTNQAHVREWMERNRPELVFHIGAKVGGIHANATQPADFLYENLMIEINVIEGARRCGVKKLVFVASNCTYPTNAKQPISEDAWFTGRLEENIHFYAVGKIAGVEMCRAYHRQYGCNFVSVIPPNLYGPGDNYHSLHSHVIAGILRRTHEAKSSGKSEIVVWGDGTARRELLYVDDLAAAILCVMKAANKHDLYNVGPGYDLSISDIARLVSEAVGFYGKICYDRGKPNGSMGKLLDSSRIRALGWSPTISEQVGLRASYEDFLELLKDPSTSQRIDISACNRGRD